MDGVLQWLLDGDPAIRWQTLRDLVGASERAVEQERSKVASDGWGARLLAKQDAEGTWAGGLSSDGGLYSPKWTSTTYTMLLLRDLGLEANNRPARKACRLLLDRGLQRDGGINYGWRGRSETCITGMVLSILAYFRCDDPRLDTIATHLLEAQMADGGWNCRRPAGATHASMHTTISVLEGLRLLELHRTRDVDALRAAQRRGREFLLVHRLFRSHRTGEHHQVRFHAFCVPATLALRHSARARLLSGCRRATRSSPRRGHRHRPTRQREDGRWSLQHSYKGKTYFQLERIGMPSRWNTLRALRVLKWWNRAETAGE